MNKKLFQYDGCKKGFPKEELGYDHEFKMWFCKSCCEFNDLFYS